MAVVAGVVFLLTVMVLLLLVKGAWPRADVA